MCSVVTVANSYTHACTMSSKLYQQRVNETYNVYKTFNGDRRLYNMQKLVQEADKRQRQKNMPRSVIFDQLALHQQMFPRWFHVEDGSDIYCRLRLLDFIDGDLPYYCKDALVLPVHVSHSTDMYDILTRILDFNELLVDALHVTIDYDSTTIDCPQKMVVMKHEDNVVPIPEAIKHQERHLSPFTIQNVVGGMFDDVSRAVLITKETIMHTRYLHGSFRGIQFNDAVPRVDTAMRVCYGFRPEIVDSITLISRGRRIVIVKSLCPDREWTITSEQAPMEIDLALRRPW